MDKWIKLSEIYAKSEMFGYGNPRDEESQSYRASVSSCLQIVQLIRIFVLQQVHITDIIIDTR